MDPCEVSARFAAHIWFINRHGVTAAELEEARQFAREHYPSFLAYANEGLGRLLLRVGRVRRTRARRRRAQRRQVAAARR
jgi:hypothetical protein